MTSPLDKDYIRIGPLHLIQDILEIYTSGPVSLALMAMRIEHRQVYGYDKEFSDVEAITRLCGELGVSITLSHNPVPTIEITLS